MDIERAKELLSTLADGVNPLTGEVLSDSDSCNQVEVVRALHTVLHELESLPKGKTKTCRKTPESRGRQKMRPNSAKCSTPAQQGRSYVTISNVRQEP